MKTTFKTWIENNKKTLMIGSVALVLAAKALSFYGEQQRANQVPPMQGGYQQQQPPVNMPQQGYGNNIDGNPYAQQQQMPQGRQQGGFWSDWFGGGNEMEEGYDNYGQAGGYGGNGYTGGYTNNANMGGYTGGYSGSGYTGNTYSTGSSSGADYTSGWYSNQASQDRMHEQFTDYIRDEANYADADGNVYKLDSRYSNNYVNNTTNEYLQTNDNSYDPNAGSTSTWTSVTPTDYSSTTSTSGGE